jgi:hypothetical protein
MSAQPLDDDVVGHREAVSAYGEKSRAVSVLTYCR